MAILVVLSMGVVFLSRRWLPMLIFWLPAGLIFDAFLLLPLGTSWLMVALLGFVVVHPLK